MRNGVWWRTNEHFYQAHKTLVPAERELIIEAGTPNLAKRLGRACTMREDWEYIKDGVMWVALMCKFNDPWLRAQLRDTGQAKLVEGNWWHDNYWGDCWCYGTPKGRAGCKEPGRNELGRMLMEIRGYPQDYPLLPVSGVV